MAFTCQMYFTLALASWQALVSIPDCDSSLELFSHDCSTKDSECMYMSSLRNKKSYHIITQLQIRGAIKDNSKIIFLISQ